MDRQVLVGCCTRIAAFKRGATRLELSLDQATYVPELHGSKFDTPTCAVFGSEGLEECVQVRSLYPIFDDLTSLQAYRHRNLLLIGCSLVYAAVCSTIHKIS
jgi:hypothetical protein